MALPSERINKTEQITNGFFEEFFESHILFMGLKSIDCWMFFFLFRRINPTAILFCTKFSAEADGNLYFSKTDSMKMF